MGLFSKTFNTLEDLFWDQIKDLYDAEHQFLDALRGIGIVFGIVAIGIFLGRMRRAIRGCLSSRPRRMTR